MKNIFALILGLFSDSSDHASQLTHEASMNFDLENVVPFLTELDAKFKFGFDVKKLGEFAASVPIQAEKSIVVDILHSGRKTKMVFRAFMDDVDAPDLYMFFDSLELAESVGDFMIGWAEARGM
jgi:hypothetical protein